MALPYDPSYLILHTPVLTGNERSGPKLCSPSVCVRSCLNDVWMIDLVDSGAPSTAGQSFARAEPHRHEIIVGQGTGYKTLKGS